MAYPFSTGLRVEKSTTEPLKGSGYALFRKNDDPGSNAAGIDARNISA